MFVLSYRAALDCGWFVLGGADFGATLDDYPQPQLTPEWKIRVLSGPHAAPDYFTEALRHVTSLVPTAHGEWLILHDWFPCSLTTAAVVAQARLASSMTKRHAAAIRVRWALERGDDLE
jgi:hypothetical protein